MNFQKTFFLLFICSSILGLIFACTGKEQPRIEDPKDAVQPDTTPGTDTVSIQTDTIPGDIEGIQSAFSKITAQLNQGILDSTSFTYNCKDEIHGTVVYFS